MPKRKDVLTFMEENHEYRWNGEVVPSFSEIVKKCGLVDLSGVNPEVLERARLYGQVVHKCCELSDLGTLDWKSVDAGAVFSLMGWELFKEQTLFIPSVIERPLYCKAFKYACTPDRWGQIDDDGVVVDIKTTSSIKRLAQLQTKAQEIALEENGYKTKVRMVVQLKQDGTYKIKYHEDDADDWKVWMSCVSYYYNGDEASLGIINEWKNRFKKGGENVY